jgi:molybdopterin-guanine dinucleotide biosynthesis protein A
MVDRESRKVVKKNGKRPIPGLVLAGGLSRRMGGGDKALRLLGGRPLIAHVIERLSAQAAPLAINANGDRARFSAFGLPVIPDAEQDFSGPLAGVLAGLRWAADDVPSAQYLVTAACDTPFFPYDLAERFLQALAGCDQSLVAVAQSAGRAHPVFGLWRLTIADELARYLASGQRKVTAFLEAQPHIYVSFDEAGKVCQGLDPFFNANTAEELAEAEAHLMKDML